MTTDDLELPAGGSVFGGAGLVGGSGRCPVQNTIASAGLARVDCRDTVAHGMRTGARRREARFELDLVVATPAAAWRWMTG